MDQKDLNLYNLIVTMQKLHTYDVIEKCPECKSRIIEWNIQDPYFLGNNKAINVFNEINNKVKELANLL